MSDFKLDASKLDVLPLDGASPAASAPADDFWYLTNGNYFGLQNANVVTQFVRESGPKADVTKRSTPRADGSYAETAYGRSCVLHIKGTLQGTSQTDLEQRMDAMRKVLLALVPVNGGTMKTKFAGAARYYDRCFPIDGDRIFDTRDHWNVLHVWYEISFDCLEPYGRDASRAVMSAPTALAVSPTNEIATNAGSAPTDPIITLSVVTAGTLSQVSIENQTTGEKITVAKSFADGDQLDIDAEAHTVKVNSVAVDYTGVFPTLASGDNVLHVTLTGAGYSVSFTEQHYSRWY